MGVKSVELEVQTNTLEVAAAAWNEMVFFGFSDGDERDKNSRVEFPSPLSPLFQPFVWTTEPPTFSSSLLKEEEEGLPASNRS